MLHLLAERREPQQSSTASRIPLVLSLLLAGLCPGCGHANVRANVLANSPTLGEVRIRGVSAEGGPCQLNREGDGYRLRVWVQSEDCKTLKSPPAVLHTYVGDKDFPGTSSEEFDPTAYKPMLSGLIPRADLFPPAPVSRIVRVHYVFVARCGAEVGGDAQGRGECAIDGN